jgi:RND family efflux transporter MFP subunit
VLNGVKDRLLFEINNQPVINFLEPSTMSRSVKLPALLILVLSLAACSRQAPTEEAVRAVKLYKVDLQAVNSQQEYAADIRARTESRLGFRVGGKLVERPAEVGQTVKKGQLLARLDEEDLRSGAQAARAQLAAAVSQRDLAQADLRRFEALRQQGFVSGAEIERRQAVLRSAQSTLEQAQAQASVQDNQAAYARLVADADGVVVGVDAEPGQVVGAGSPVVRLARNGPRDAAFAVPEDKIRFLRVGQPAKVALWAASGNAAGVTLDGKIREVAASADPVTRTYAVKVSLEGADQPPLGATATVRLAPTSGAQPAAAPAAIRLPTSALWQQGQGSAVWLFDAAAGVVRARSVRVAGMDGNEVLIADGLKPGEEVVSTGTHVLNDGQSVVRYATQAAR